jgi:hypothetical protein
MKPNTPDANATIQLDRAELDEILENVPLPAPSQPAEAPLPPTSEPPVRRRTVPPPLPPSASVRPPETPSAGKRIGVAAVFAVLLGLAITAGVKAGGAFRPPAAPARQAVEAPQPQAPAPVVAPAPAVITIPTVDLSAPPADSTEAK